MVHGSSFGCVKQRDDVRCRDRRSSADQSDLVGGDSYDLGRAESGRPQVANTRVPGGLTELLAAFVMDERVMQENRGIFAAKHPCQHHLATRGRHEVTATYHQGHVVAQEPEAVGPRKRVGTLLAHVWEVARARPGVR